MPVTPQPSRSFQAAVVYVGVAGWADIHKCLLQLIREFNACGTFSFTLASQIIEVDILRGCSKLDLVEPGVRAWRLAICCSPSSLAVPAYRCVLAGVT